MKIRMKILASILAIFAVLGLASGLLSCIPNCGVAGSGGLSLSPINGGPSDVGAGIWAAAVLVIVISYVYWIWKK